MRIFSSEESLPTNASQGSYVTIGRSGRGIERQRQGVLMRLKKGRISSEKSAHEALTDRISSEEAREALTERILSENNIK
jgi:hypothetical protein